MNNKTKNFFNDIKNIYANRTIAKCAKGEFMLLIFQMIISLSVLMYSYIKHGEITLATLLFACLAVPVVDLVETLIINISKSVLHKAKIFKQTCVEIAFIFINFAITAFWVHINLPINNMFSIKSFIFILFIIVVYAVYKVTSNKVHTNINKNSTQKLYETSNS